MKCVHTFGTGRHKHQADITLLFEYISGQEGVSRLQIVASPCCPFELSPLNLLKSGKLVHLITLIPFEIF